MIDLLFAQKGAAHVPAHALVDDGVAHAQTVKDLERTFGVAHGTRTERYAVFFVKQQHIQTVKPRVDGGGQPDRTGANHHQRLALGSGLHQVVGRMVGEGGVGVRGHLCSSGNGATVPNNSPLVN